MSDISDDYMREMLKTTRRYTVVILHRTSKRDEPDSDRIVWEHGRRNFELRTQGSLCIVCPVERDESDVTGICIFTTDAKDTRRIMDGDPAVRAGIFAYEIHSIAGFPGDALTK